LPADEKNVTPYLYLSIPALSEKKKDGTYDETTDVELYNKSILNQVLVDSFHAALKEVAIECVLNAETYCRVCSPTNQPMWTADPARDILAPDPCHQVVEKTVKACEIIYNGDTYYYSDCPTSLYDYKVFAFDKRLNGYRQLKETEDAFAELVEAIRGKGECTSTAQPKSGGGDAPAKCWVEVDGVTYYYRTRADGSVAEIYVYDADFGDYVQYERRAPVLEAISAGQAKCGAEVD
jgi:hypothetical protein